MTRQQAIHEVIACAEAMESLRVAREEATAMRNMAAAKAREAVFAATWEPDNRQLAAEARRAVGALSRAMYAILELAAISEWNRRQGEAALREHGLREHEVAGAEAELAREDRETVAA